jgi:hypothetical protein
MKDINEIINELRQHPDYVASSIWTTELVRQEIYNRVESVLEDCCIDYIVDEIYTRNINRIYKSIDYCYDNGFEMNDILDEVNIQEEIEEINEELKNKLV